jgi:YfiH family protein
MTLEILTSDNLSPFRHGFFTRRGGVSAGIFKGLNCGAGSSDQSEIVQMNRKLVAEAMSVRPENLLSVNQVHSATAVIVDGPLGGERPTADAIVSATPGVALGILTADCAPVLFADQKAGVVGAAHAGWKGALAGVLEETIVAMETLGARTADISVTIGPCISQRNYEVGQEFLEDFIAEEPEYVRFFAQGKDPEHYQFDLPSFCLYRVREAGVADADWVGHCTYADPERFYSYRRTTHLKQADYGRLISVISADR